MWVYRIENNGGNLKNYREKLTNNKELIEKNEVFKYKDWRIIGKKYKEYR